MRVCDIITQFIISTGINDVFMFPGGGNKFLIDGLASNKQIHSISCHHEQGLSMAVVGYAKYKGMGYGMVTTGCGGTNTITGVLDAWQDSTACMFISGQCHSKQLIKCVDAPVRQVGIQEADIVTIVSSITKYAVMLEKPEDILYELEKAYFIAREGRPGPVWLDIPLDMQAAQVDEHALRHFDESEYKSSYITDIMEDDIEEIIELLKYAKRPVILGGQGVRLSGAIELFEKFVEHFDIPAVFARMGTDALLTVNKYNTGVAGKYGNRSGNIIMQNADVLLVLGCRLGINTVGYSYDLFARDAKVIVVDIDADEHKKNTVHIDKFVQADLKKFFVMMLNKYKMKHSWWMEKCTNLKKRYPACTEKHYEDKNGISVYAFLNELSKRLPEKVTICTDTGSAFFAGPQVLVLNNREQRYITSGGQADMGFVLPACVGISIACEKKEVIGIAGDGSFMLNIQELQTVAGNQLPVKLFVLNNNGYMSIRQMQQNVCGNRLLGVDRDTGLTFPDFKKIAEGFHIRYIRMEKVEELETKFLEIYDHDGPVLCEVVCQENEEILCAGTAAMADGSKKQVLEDMVPYLDREELENLIYEIKENESYQFTME